MEDVQDEDLVRIKDLLRHTGEFIAYFELIEMKMLEWRQEMQQQASRLHHQQEKLSNFSDSILEKIDNHGTKMVDRITNELIHYDPHPVHRIIQESCEQVTRTANEGLTQSRKLLNLFQVRFIFFAGITALLSAFTAVFYLSGELPWETHYKATSERKLGKALLQAWPSLSKEEKTKIIGYLHNE